MDYDDKLIDDIAKAYWSQEETDDFPLTIAAIKRAFAQVRESERERLAKDGKITMLPPKQSPPFAFPDDDYYR